MDDLTIQIVGGLVVVVISGSSGYLSRKFFFNDDRILPKMGSNVEIKNYSHLNGRWHLYWVSYNPPNPSEPVWFKGIQFFNINKNMVTGTTEHVEHPIRDLHYKMKGEIRAGRMIFTDTCMEDETDYATILIPNLRSMNQLVGIWTGLDNLLRPIAAPCVFSRKELNASELNMAIKDSPMSLVPIANYKVGFKLYDFQ